jgi:hypothetical protein
MTNGFVQWIKHVQEVTARPGEIPAQPMRTQRATIELDTDEMGYPLLPPAPTGKTQETLQAQKDLIRSFLVMHYRKLPFARTEGEG